MDKKQFTNYIANHFNCDSFTANTVVNIFTESLYMAVSEGGYVDIDNLGKFAVSRIPSRKIKVPKNGKTITTKEHYRLYFKPCPNLKLAYNY